MTEAVLMHKIAEKTGEFPVHNLVVRCTLSGRRVEERVFVHDTVPLKHWKSAHAIVEVLRRDWKTGRRLGHAGGAVELYRFDRFALSAWERIWRQVHAADAPCHHGLSPGLPTDVFSCSWVVPQDPETANKIASFKAPWLALDVDYEVADVLAEDLQLEFARSVLPVSSRCQDRGDDVGLIADTF